MSDLIIGCARGPFPDRTVSACVFSENFTEVVASGRKFANILGDEIQILAVFLAKGSHTQEAHTYLQEHVQCKIVAWFDASPGEVTDALHHLFAPKSLSNTFSRSMDKQVHPVETQSDVSASKPGPTEPTLQDGKKSRVRIRK